MQGEAPIYGSESRSVFSFSDGLQRGRPPSSVMQQADSAETDGTIFS